METGWIKLHRKMMSWEWFKDSNAVHLFVYLLLSAASEPREWRGVSIARGQVAVSVSELCGTLGMSVKSVRTAMGKLEESGAIERLPTSRYTLVTIANYDSYQTPADAAQAGDGGKKRASQRARSGANQNGFQLVDTVEVARTGTEQGARSGANSWAPKGQAGQEENKNERKNQREEEQEKNYPRNNNTTTVISSNNNYNAQAGARVREGFSISIYSLPDAELELERARWYEVFFWAGAMHPKDEVSRFVCHNERYGWSSPTSGHLFSTAAERLALARQWAANERCVKGRDRNLQVWRALYDRTTALRPELGRRFLDTRNSIEADNRNRRAVFHFHRDLCCFFSEDPAGRSIMAEVVPGYEVGYSPKVEKR